MGWASIWATGILFGASAHADPSPAPLAPIVLENFESKSLDWTKGNEVDGKSDYFLVKQGSAAFLRGKYIPGTDAKVIFKKITWDTEHYPFLEWRWRANRFPTGAKILDSDKSDAVAQVYVGWKIRNRVYNLKYFWSESDPVGATLHEGRWNPLGEYMGLVIRMGGKTNEWHTEKRNVVEDFQKYFGRTPPAEANGLGVLTDGDQTHTEPEADYADFTALPKP